MSPLDLNKDSEIVANEITETAETIETKEVNEIKVIAETPTEVVDVIAEDNEVPTITVAEEIAETVEEVTVAEQLTEVKPVAPD